MPQLLKLVVVIALLTARLATAEVADEVAAPDVEAGEGEIELKFGQARDGGRTVERGATFSAGYGISDFWFTEASLNYVRQIDGATELESIEWENKFQLTDIDASSVNFALLAEIERSREAAEGWEVKFGPLLQADVGRFVLNANVLFEKRFRVEGDAAEREWETLYQWQARYRLSGPFEIGVQGFVDDETTKVGPVIFGRLPLGEELKYNVGWLKGVTDETPNHTLRVQFELEFE